jgi:hypothetical protein
MSNLLSIETAFLNLPQVKQALNLTEIRGVQRTIVNAKKKKFEQTLSLSKMALNVVNWFNSDEGKSICNDEGIAWNSEEIGNKIFGFQKSYFYKVIKAGKLDDEVIETFKTKCDEAEAVGDEPDRSLAGLLKYSRVLALNASGGGDDASGGGDDAEIETRAQTVFTMTFKTNDGNISVRIDDAGTIKTTNTKEQINEAINFLKSFM